MPAALARKFCAANAAALGAVAVLLACGMAPCPVLRAADKPTTTNKPADADIPIPPAGPISAADRDFFEAHVRPVLVNECYKCHSRDADKIKGGLMLDTREGVLHGGETGPALVPGKPDDSLIIQAIRYTDDDLQMPPKGQKLSDDEIADLTEWVRRGAPDPRSLAVKGSTPNYGGVGREHWSFLPVKPVAVPVVQDAAWCLNPIDNFVLARLETENMKPNPAADRRTWLRRVTFDLIGLPPSDEDVQEFVTDNSPGAYAKVVDRLLASPQYGEHWARYWLDVARFADTKGDTPRRDDPRFPYAWTYRDYAIDAFNHDKPYNQFIIEQLAADRLVAEEAKRTHTSVDKMDQSSYAALGFLTLGNQFNGNIRDIVNDQIDVTSKAFLGLTVSCARCHDHKFDPIPQKDYYSLYGVFANSRPPESVWKLPFVHPVPRDAAFLDYEAKVIALVKRDAQLKENFAEFRRSQTNDPVKRRELIRQEVQIQGDIGDLESDHPGAPPRSCAIFDVPHPEDYPVLLRGEAENKGDIVPRRFLEILSPDPKNRPEWHKDSGRLELARAIADPANPMTARVLVNRLWQQDFGHGFVDTPDDLGTQSSAPTHPELLDWLAGQFVKDGWSIKKLQRLIVLSQVYRESSDSNPAYDDVDPDNHLLWRANLHRLDFEELHDSLLFTAGTLDLTKIGGKSVLLSSADFATRRCLYTYVDRHNPPELFTQFDFPNPSVPSGRRYDTLVPQQALFLMNSALVMETARKLVERPQFQGLTADPQRVTFLYLEIFNRLPSGKEISSCLDYIKHNPGENSATATAAKNMADAASRIAKRRAEISAKAAKNLRGKNAYQPEPAGAAFLDRTPVDAWTKLADGLFQTNEAIFLN
ncbi:MAG TPA: PSD1 and planctomycete cytochrome C domain-containing protein [Opitutaceae bacterium]|nr:PSD1 and planctomycete cytochrome C domain-containing protein [Opitutaceae bacterium]